MIMSGATVNCTGSAPSSWLKLHPLACHQRDISQGGLAAGHYESERRELNSCISIRLQEFSERIMV